MKEITLTVKLATVLTFWIHRVGPIYMSDGPIYMSDGYAHVFLIFEPWVGRILQIPLYTLFHGITTCYTAY